MLRSLCLLHLYHPLPSLSAECLWKTQDPRTASYFLGIKMEFGVVSVSTCWGHSAAVVESTCQFCWLPFTNGLCWRDGGRVVVWSEAGALCQSNRNDLWTEVHARPKEQVIVSGSFWFLPKSVVKGGGEEQAMPNRWLPPVQASVRLQTELEKSAKCWPMHQHWHRAGNDWCQQKFWSRSFPQWTKGLDWNSGTSHLGVVLLLGIHILNGHYSSLTVGYRPACTAFKKPVFRGCCS